VFHVSVARVVKWSQRARQTGGLVTKRMGGRRPWRSKLDGERSWLLARLAEKPDLTLKALAGELRERGVVVAIDTVALPAGSRDQVQKTVFASELDRPDVVRRRTW
jgi:transposase